MNRLAHAVATIAIASSMLACCTSPSKPSEPSAASSSAPVTEAPAHAKKPSPAPGDTAKYAAPVAISGQLQDGKARIDVRFDSPGTDVKVNVYGVDGMQVQTTSPKLENAVVSAGEVATFDATYTCPPGRSNLVVAVSGTFNGTPLTKVSSFSVGEAKSQMKSGPQSETDDQGGRVKVMPSGH